MHLCISVHRLQKEASRKLLDILIERELFIVHFSRPPTTMNVHQELYVDAIFGKGVKDEAESIVSRWRSHSYSVSVVHSDLNNEYLQPRHKKLIRKDIEVGKLPADGTFFGNVVLLVPRLRLVECLGVEPFDKWLKNTRFYLPEADLKILQFVCRS